MVNSILIVFGSLPSTIYALQFHQYCMGIEAYSYCSKQLSAWGLLSVVMVSSISMIFFLVYNSVLSFLFTSYSLLRSMLYDPPSRLYQLLPALYALLSKHYLRSSTLYAL